MTFVSPSRVGCENLARNMRGSPSSSVLPLCVLALVCTASLSSCSKEGAVPEGEVRAGDLPGAVPIPDAGTLLTVSMVLQDGSLAPVAYEPNAPTFIEPAAGFDVIAKAGLRNYRLRLFDEADRAMVSDDEAEATPEGGTHYRARFAEPLKTGHQYTLVLDAQSGDAATNGKGRVIPEQRIELKVLGEREKVVAAPPKPTRKRRQR
jgi:hypothetical protein